MGSLRFIGRTNLGGKPRLSYVTESLAPKQAITGFPKRDATKSFALAVAGNQNTNGGGGDKGKNKTALVQNTDTYKENLLGQREQPRVKILSAPSCNSRVTCKESSLGQREQLWGKIVSNFNRKNRDTCKESTLG